MSERRKRTRRVGLTRRVVGESAARRSKCRAWAPPLLAALASAAHAGAGMTPIPDHDFQWAVIGDPGNAAYAGEYNDHFGGAASERLVGRGSVGYLYRMSVTEVTVEQWVEFARAYAPFLDSPTQATGLIADAGHVLGFDEDGTPIFQASRFPNAAVQVIWRFAARYVNWLHNGKALTKEAFETGVYDTATFGEALDDEGNRLYFTDQLKRHPDARFWIPTLDEWIKAAHWDPNRHGQGEGGWRLHPGGQDTPLTPGLPGEPGAQTSAGVENLETLITSGAYPATNAPWGLLDTSGGVTEWLEDPITNHLGMRARMIKFSHAGVSFHGLTTDPLFQTSTSTPNSGRVGLRIASTMSRSADLNADGAVGSADLSAVLEAWGAGASSPADLTLDGVVDGADLGMLLGAWGAAPEAAR